MDSRDYLFMADLFPQIPRPRLGPILTVNSIAINQVAPVISGTTEVGQTLSCTTGTWAFEPTGYRYQWLRNGAAIPGETTNAHEVIEADTGRTLHCAVVAENVEGLSHPAVSNGLFIPALDVPTNTVAPIINGNTFVGSALSCTTGTWDHDPISYGYQWRRAGVDISGAVSNAYIVNLLDTGLNVTCAVTATNENGPSSPVSSNALLIDNIPVNSVAPVISGTTTVGQTLTCTNGTWSYTPTSYAYQWKRNGSSIGSATSSTYLLALADEGTSITCAVTATNPQGTSTPATSNTLSIPTSGDEPVLTLTGDTLAENASLGSVVGTLSVINPSGAYSFTIAEDPSDKFDIVDDELQIDHTLDYELAATHLVTIEADNGVDEPLSDTFTIHVTNVLEETLAALTLPANEIEEASPEDTAIGTLVGRTGGSTLSLTDDAGGRFKLTGLNVVAGAVPTDFATAETHNITIREVHADATNSPRDTVLTINVTEIAVFTSVSYVLLGGSSPGAVASSGTRSMITSSGMVNEG